MKKKFGYSCMLINPVGSSILSKRDIYQAEEALGLIKALDWTVVSLGEKNVFSRENYGESEF